MAFPLLMRVALAALFTLFSFAGEPSRAGNRDAEGPVFDLSGSEFSFSGESFAKADKPKGRSALGSGLGFVLGDGSFSLSYSFGQKASIKQSLWSGSFVQRGNLGRRLRLRYDAATLGFVQEMVQRRLDLHLNAQGKRDLDLVVREIHPKLSVKLDRDGVAASLKQRIRFVAETPRGRAVEGILKDRMGGRRELRLDSAALTLEAISGDSLLVDPRELFPEATGRTDFEWLQVLGPEVAAPEGGELAIEVPDCVCTLVFELSARGGGLAGLSTVVVHVLRDVGRARFVAADAEQLDGFDPLAPRGSRANPYREFSEAKAANPGGADLYVMQRQPEISLEDGYRLTPSQQPGANELAPNTSLFGGFDRNWVRRPEQATRFYIDPSAPLRLELDGEDVTLSRVRLIPDPAAGVPRGPGDPTMLRASGRGGRFLMEDNEVSGAPVAFAPLLAPAPTTYGVVLADLDEVVLRGNSIRAHDGRSGITAGDRPATDGNGIDGLASGGCSKAPNKAALCGGEPNHLRGGTGEGAYGGEGGFGVGERGKDAYRPRPGSVHKEGRHGLSVLGIPFEVTGMGGPIARNGSQGKHGSSGNRGSGGGGGTHNLGVGGRGGEGGGPGNGGPGGVAGQGGGSSVALLLARIRSYRLEDNSILAGNGGHGGGGGHGARGQSGGKGGSGQPGSCFVLSCGGAGGDGAPGGNGGSGGSGGSGSGGSSFGLLLGRAADLGPGVVRGNTIRSGDAGAGGRSRYPGFLSNGEPEIRSAAGGWSYAVATLGQVVPENLELEGNLLEHGAAGLPGAGADGGNVLPGPPGRAGDISF